MESKFKSADEIFKELHGAYSNDWQYLLNEFYEKVCNEQKQIIVQMFLEQYGDIQFAKEIQSAPIPEITKITYPCKNINQINEVKNWVKKNTVVKERFDDGNKNQYYEDYNETFKKYDQIQLNFTEEFDL